MNKMSVSVPGRNSVKHTTVSTIMKCLTSGTTFVLLVVSDD